MRLEEQLRDTIDTRVQAVRRPTPDPAAARSQGRRLRRRRQGAGLAAALTVATVGAVALPRAMDAVEERQDQSVSLGQLDYSKGLRAFASPDEDGELWIGGRSFPAQEFGFLDTDAVATPHGLVYFDDGAQAHLLAESGTDSTLAPAPDGGGDFHPSAKADAVLPVVAFTRGSTEGVTVQLEDLDAGRTVGTVEVPCGDDDCDGVRVDAVDRGLVFVRTADGTFVWDPGARAPDDWTPLGEGSFRVADARNGSILWAGAPATPASNSPVRDWRMVKGQIDAELSHDGRHVLYWAPTLEPVDPGGEPITLRVKGAIWFTFDTDGSVLAAVNGGPEMRSSVHDCELPSGRCTKVGTISTRSGDPVFIGNDM